MDVTFESQLEKVPTNKIYVNGGRVAGIENWMLDNGAICNILDFQRLPDGRFHVRSGSAECDWGELTGTLQETTEFEGPYWGPKYKAAFELEEVTLPKLEAIGLTGYEIVEQ